MYRKYTFYLYFFIILVKKWFGLFFALVTKMVMKGLNMKNLKGGFTLTELIMVTIILFILAGVAIPRYMSIVTKFQ